MGVTNGIYSMTSSARRLHREISRLLTFQNTIDVASGAPKNIDDVATI